jgi:hypothetical protein
MEPLPSTPPPQGSTEAPNQYVINNVQQLFELNPNLVNFKSSFAVKSLSNEPFMGIVINQQTLDSGENLAFKTADQGFFSGEIIQDNNLYTNWYLALKSQKPNKVMINIQTQPVPARQTNPVDQYNVDAHPHAYHPPIQSRESYFTPTNIMTVVAVLAAGAAFYFAYQYYKNNQSQSKSMNKVAASLLPSQQPVIAPMVVPTAVPEVISNESIIPKTMVDTLSAPSALDIGGSSAEDILGSDLLGQINKLPNI